MGISPKLGLQLPIDVAIIVGETREESSSLRSKNIATVSGQQTARGVCQEKQDPTLTVLPSGLLTPDWLSWRLESKVSKCCTFTATNRVEETYQTSRMP